MSRTALGMVETVGILAAYEAADVALKAANIKLVGYEISRGGMVVVKFTGDIGAVKAAVSAAEAAASQLSTVFSAHVIPRPSRDVESMINSEDTINTKNSKKEKNKSKSNELEKDSTELEKEKMSEAENSSVDKELDADLKEIEKDTKNDIKEEDFEDEEDLKENEKDDNLDLEEEITESRQDDQEDDVESKTEPKKEKKKKDICNLCGDPDCPRQKGDLHTDCIHYDELENN